jgi:hypothetical protein
VYGTGEEYAGLDGADPALQGSLFTSPGTKELLFGKGCMRAAGNPCVDRSSPYYDVTHNGLDTLLHGVYGKN